MQQDHEVGILLDAVVDGDAVRDEVVGAQNRRVIDLLDTVGLNGHDGVPQHVVDGRQLEVRLVQHLHDTVQAQGVNLPGLLRGEAD